MSDEVILTVDGAVERPWSSLAPTWTPSPRRRMCATCRGSIPSGREMA